jgi:cation transport ATPase
MTPVLIQHETPQRLRAALPARADAAILRARLEQLPGVHSVRVNGVQHCVVVHHDGRPLTRDGVIERLATLEAAPAARGAAGPRRAPRSAAALWGPALMAMALPALPGGWRAGAALATVAARALAQREHWRRDATAVLLDSASLVAAALSGHPMVVTASVTARTLSESWSARLVAQADALLDHLLPVEAAQYPVRRRSGSGWSATPAAALRAGDRLRLEAGSVVPVDGHVVAGRATLVPLLHHASAAAREVGVGDAVGAGEQLHEGSVELAAEATVAASRLERLRANVRHAAGARDPAGRLSANTERLVALPLTGAALVLGLTGDGSRAAAMLQADPQQGLDLAQPVAREAALYTMARQGLLAGGLEAVERLAVARTLVLQDTGVLTLGRWRLASVRAEPGLPATTVRGWMARLAGWSGPPERPPPDFGDAQVRRWWTHGALLHCGGGQVVHLAGPHALHEVWGLEPGTGPRTGLRRGAAPDRRGGLRRELALVSDARVVARVVLESAWRPGAVAHLQALGALGFERIVLLPEVEDGGADVAVLAAHGGIEVLAGADSARAERLAEAARDGEPLVLVHTVLRDLLPAGSLSLCPADAEAGAHGVLLGDPLHSLLAARRAAQAVHRRLRRQQAAAVAVNAALMTAAAMRWLPPVGTSLLHHGFVFAMLVDSLRLESLDLPDAMDRSQHPPIA